MATFGSLNLALENKCFSEKVNFMAIYNKLMFQTKNMRILNFSICHENLFKSGLR